VYDEPSDDDSAGEEDDYEEYVPWPPQTPTQHRYASRPVSSNSSRSCSHGYSPGSFPARQQHPLAAYHQVPEANMPRTAAAYARPRSSNRPVQPHLQRQAESMQPAAHANAAAAARVPCTKQQGLRHIPVKGPGHTGSSPAAPKQQQQQQQQQQTRAAAQPTRPRRQLSSSEAATTIQSWWRMSRLARQQPALHALTAASAALREVAAKFDAYKAPEAHSSQPRPAALQAPAAGCISHEQYLELNELAMRVLLELDCTPCGVPELRAVRKRLAATAVALLDGIQAAFSATVTASMELPDSLVDEALQQVGGGRTASATTAQQQAPAAEQQQQQQQQDGVDPEAAVAAPSDAEAEAEAEAASWASAADEDSCAARQPVQNDEGPEAAVRVVLKLAGQCCDAATQTD